MGSAIDTRFWLHIPGSILLHPRSATGWPDRALLAVA